MISNKEKEKKRQYGHECYKNISEDEKQKLAKKLNLLIIFNN